jgi:hypothetical protein
MIKEQVALVTALLAVGGVGCGDGAATTTADAASPAETASVPDPNEVRCGMPDVYYSAYDAKGIAKLAGCTVLVGWFQQDSVRDLSDFTGLESVRRIEGALNLFRCPGFTSLKGLDNLETIDGNLYIHLNENLVSLAGLEKLRTITGNLLIEGNDKLPLADANAFAARITVGGTKTVR